MRRRDRTARPLRVVHYSSAVNTLRTSTTDETRNHMTAEVQELRARKLLAQHEKIVLDGIERKRKHAAYGLCIDDTKTRAITQKSTAITRIAVTRKLKQSFQDELSKLAFRHVEVELKEVGGTEGVLYHKLVLTRAPGVESPKVVSEGEQRCLSIAEFFAELSTADDPSSIVFDARRSLTRPVGAGPAGAPGGITADKRRAATPASWPPPHRPRPPPDPTGPPRPSLPRSRAP